MKKALLPLEPAGAMRVGSVRTFLTEMESFAPEAGFTYFFRGHSRHSHRLVPSVFRNPGWIAHEDVLFKELILRCPNDFDGQASTFQTLVKMQHYSLPTRLLDITSNPLMALYFASEAEKDAPKESGEVVVFRIPTAEIKYFDSDTVSVIANISRRPASFKLPDAGLSLDDFNGDGGIRLLLHEVKREKPYFEPAILREHMESVVCVKPKLDNARIIKQDGAFLLFGMDGDKLKPAAIPLGYQAATSRRILVKHAEKADVRKQLESLGLTQAAIFPEIDKVADFIKRAYASRPAPVPSGK
jgi:hypothetical protein